MKLRGSTGKYIIRKAVEPWLPAGVLDRPKQGFAVPLAKWVRGDFGSYVEGVWRDSGADQAGALRPEAVSALLAERLPLRELELFRLGTAMANSLARATGPNGNCLGETHHPKSQGKTCQGTHFRW